MISRFSNPFPLLLKGEMNFTHVFLDRGFGIHPKYKGDMYVTFVDAFNLQSYCVSLALDIFGWTCP